MNISSLLPAHLPTREGTTKDYFLLLKPRVMSLVVFTGWVGLMLAPGSIHPFIAFVSILCIALGAGAAGAINMWYDRDIDALMSRTQKRPLPAGKISPQDALTFGVVLSLMSTWMMLTLVGIVPALLLAFSILFYVLAYTMTLKRSTPQNIVIGGAAGAIPPMIGWATISGEISWASFSLFLIIFMWTPPHFWALSLYRSEDYAKAGVPMLPVTHGVRTTQWHILIYTLLLVPTTILPYALGFLGPLYLGSALLLGAGMILLSLQVMRKTYEKSAKQLFAFSIFYLFLLFLAMLGDKFL